MDTQGDNVGANPPSGVSYIDDKLEMAAYDALPPVLRAMVRDAPMKLAATDVLARLRAHGLRSTRSFLQYWIQEFAADLREQDARELCAGPQTEVAYNAEDRTTRASRAIHPR